MPTTVRRRLAAASLVILVPALGACGGFNYQTDQVYQPGVGVNDQSGQVGVLGAVVVSGIDGQGTLVTSLANDSSDQTDSLTTVTPTDPNAGLTVRVTAPVEIKPRSLVNLADTGAISVSGDSVKPGGYVRLTLQFQSGQSTSVNVPVVPQTGEYGDIEPASPSGSASPSVSPAPSPSASPSP
jgi:hypothetical protein